MNLAKIVQYSAIIGLTFTAGMFYMDLHSFIKELDPKKHDEELNEFAKDLKKLPEISSDFDPIIKTQIKEFDFIMNLEFDRNIGSLNNSIKKYKVGQYCLSSTPDGKAILKLIEYKLNELISDNDVIIKVNARGTADGIPVIYNSYYDGQLGDYLKIKYFKYNSLDEELTATLIAGQTIMENEHFALLRAYDLVNQLKIKYSIDPNNIKIYIQEYKQIGGDYRRCDLSIIVENAFFKKYNELNIISRFIYDEF